MTPSGILDIIILIYYSPALLLAVYAGLKHGFSRSSGWYQLIALSLFRVVGSALGLAAISHPSTGLIIASFVFSSIGTVTLIGALLGLIGRVDQGLKDRAINPRVVRVINLLLLAALIVSIVGGSYLSSSSSSSQDYGHYLAKVAVIMIIVVYVLAVGYCIHSAVNHRHVPASEKRLLHVTLISLPFVLVRLVYSVCSTFLYSNSNFSLLSTTVPGVVIRAIMAILMEFIVVGLYLWAGCTVDRSAEREAERAQRHGANGAYQGKYGMVPQTDFNKQETGYARA